MNGPYRALCAILFGVALAAAVAPLHAQSDPCEKVYNPQVGQAGRDVIWVPTPDELVLRMLEMAQVTGQDVVVDLGSGDGRIPIAAARRFGARARGIDYNPNMVRLAECRAAQAGVLGRVSYVNANLFDLDFSDATVVTMYLLPSLNLKLRPTVLKMRPGTRVVSHAFTMGDWEADRTETVDGRTAHLWIVPAQVSGTWAVQIQGGASYTLSLAQTYQMVEGTLRGSRAGKVHKGRLRGDQITLTIVEEGGATRELSGRVSGDAMSGVNWSAKRNGP